MMLTIYILLFNKAMLIYMDGISKPVACIQARRMGYKHKKSVIFNSLTGIWEQTPSVASPAPSH